VDNPEENNVQQVSTGIAGLDSVLDGGLAPYHPYLVKGDHGSGKTTFGLQFCLAGVERGERVLLLSTCESEGEIREIAASHGWSLDGVTIHYHDARETLGNGPDQSVFHPSEVDLPRTIEDILSIIREVDPQRLVIDSLSEIKLLAADIRWFRRQVLLLREELVSRRCTTLFCGGRETAEDPIESIVHGVVDLQHSPPDYGPDQRQLRLVKMRGQQFISGYHDMRIRTGGIEVYPRLVAADHPAQHEKETISSGVPELDALFDGGADRGAATLLLGPAGTGKSIIATQYALAAAERGESSAIYIFDEQRGTFLRRAAGLGMELSEHVDKGTISIQQIDPAELSPGEFSHAVQQAVEQRNVRLVVIDSLSGYVHAMPSERALALHLHELLTYLGQQGVTVLLTMSQHGLPGSDRYTPFDLSYIADSVLLLHVFEFAGELRGAISVYKRRGGPHERSLRELKFTDRGIRIGEPLSQFQKILSGMPDYFGESLPDVRDEEQT
jgi:circadian clock protein KaiC